MKLKTLVRIAKEIEREHGIHVRCTVNEMLDMLRQAAGNCRTKAKAKKAILAEIYDISESEEE